MSATWACCCSGMVDRSKRKEATRSCCSVRLVDLYSELPLEREKSLGHPVKKYELAKKQIFPITNSITMSRFWALSALYILSKSLCWWEINGWHPDPDSCQSHTAMRESYKSLESFLLSPAHESFRWSRVCPSVKHDVSELRGDTVLV